MAHLLGDGLGHSDSGLTHLLLVGDALGHSGSGVALPLLVDGAGDGVLPKADAVLADLDRLNLGLAHFGTDERQRESLRLRSRPSVATGGDGLGCSRGRFGSSVRSTGWKRP